MTRVVVVGDIRLYREGVASYLSGDSRFVLMGTAANRREALRCVEQTRPDIAIVDMVMADGLAVVRDIIQVSAGTRVIALTVPEVEQAVIACAEAGISGYVPREGSLDDLVSTIERATRGESLMSPKMVAGLLRRVSALAGDHTPEASRAELTVRESEIVQLIQEGLSNKQIAVRLTIELATVKNHVHNILEKLHLHSRGEVVAHLRRVSRPSLFSFETGLSRDQVR